MALGTEGGKVRALFTCFLASLLQGVPFQIPGRVKERRHMWRPGSTSLVSGH